MHQYFLFILSLNFTKLIFKQKSFSIWLLHLEGQKSYFAKAFCCCCCFVCLLFCCFFSSLLFYSHFLWLKKMKFPEIGRQSRMKKCLLSFFLSVPICLCLWLIFQLFIIVIIIVVVLFCFTLISLGLKNWNREKLWDNQGNKRGCLGFFVYLFVRVCVCLWFIFQLFIIIIAVLFYSHFLSTEKGELREIVRQSRMKCTQSKNVSNVTTYSVETLEMRLAKLSHVCFLNYVMDFGRKYIFFFKSLL